MRRKKPDEEDGYGYVCSICEDFGELLCCERCREGFHLSCVGLQSCPDSAAWLCDDCSENKVRCFDCKEYGCFKVDTYPCGVNQCSKMYHDRCSKEWARPQSKRRKRSIFCPHHYCDICWNTQSNHSGKEYLHRCLKCPIAYHESCMPEGTGLLEDIPGFLLCAKHNEEPKCQFYDNAPTDDVKIGFNRLPLPNAPQDFKIPMSLKVAVRKFQNKPSPYAHIRRNIYLVKKPRKKSEEENMQCSCRASDGSAGACDKDCLCGMLLSSCSSSCKCGDTCMNLPFQKRPGRKMKVVKTERCGWGLKAEEDIKAGDFLVEYVGEVINDETCEKRLWAMKDQGESNFYMCEISREMVIDATFKGNLSRFINHSCCPNSELQKWEIEGEIRIGVFATTNIVKGQYVNYDYQFIQFGTDQFCHCGASGCRGQLGKPQKQKNCSEMALHTITRNSLISRPLGRPKLFEGFSVEQGCTPINGTFPHQKNSFGEATQDLHHQHKGLDNWVGLRVKVWWPLDQKFYHGKIVRYDPQLGKHQIIYDDGQEEDLLMTKERWEVEKSLPFQRKRGASLVPLDRNKIQSPVMDGKGDPHPGLKCKSDELSGLGQNSMQAFGLWSQSGGAPDMAWKKKAWSAQFGPERGQLSEFEQAIHNYPSPSDQQTDTHSLILEQQREDLLALSREQKGSPSSVLEQQRVHLPVSEEWKDHPSFVPDQQRVICLVSEKGRDLSLFLDNETGLLMLPASAQRQRSISLSTEVRRDFPLDTEQQRTQSIMSDGQSPLSDEARDRDLSHELVQRIRKLPALQCNGGN